jgi:hypothetical protein
MAISRRACSTDLYPRLNERNAWSRIDFQGLFETNILLETGSVLCFASGDFLLGVRLMDSLLQSMDGFLDYRAPRRRLRVRCHCRRYLRWLL